MYEYFNTSENFESDLALERRRANLSCEGISEEKDFASVGVWERISITSKEGAENIGRPIGHYDTLTLDRMDLLSFAEISDASEEIASELCALMEYKHVNPERILVVGLGNRELTPDSVGPRCAELVYATMHIKENDQKMFDALECSEIAVFKPGVMSESGIDSAVTISSICDVIMPDAVIAIDALASSSRMRLGRTIQLSDTGIFPGSGIGNKRGAITEETVGAPVIAIGVPTVIDARRIAGENEDMSVEAMFVSPKEINGIVKSAAKIIAEGINQAFGINEA